MPENSDTHPLNLTTEQVGQETAAIRDVNQVNASHHLEQLGIHVRRRPKAGRRIIDLAGVRLRIGNEFGKRFPLKIQRKNSGSGNKCLRAIGHDDAISSELGSFWSSSWRGFKAGPVGRSRLRRRRPAAGTSASAAR